MSVTISLVTSKREHLYDLARLLAAGIDPAFLQEPSKPVEVTLRGSYISGKKIFPDLMRETLGIREKFEGNTDRDPANTFPHQTHRAGKFRPDEAEFWTGDIAGRRAEINFIDGGYTLGNGEGTWPDRQKWHEVRDMFRQRRTAGGIDFIHNDQEAGQSAGIDIWVENKRSAPKIGNEREKAKESPLSGAFNDATADWSRYVEITVRDERLLQSHRFLKMLETIQDCKGAYAQYEEQGVVSKIFNRFSRKPLVWVNLCPASKPQGLLSAGRA